MYLGQKRLNEKHTVASVPDCHRLGFHAEIQIIFGTVCRVLDLLYNHFRDSVQSPRPTIIFGTVCRVLDLQLFLGQCVES